MKSRCCAWEESIHQPPSTYKDTLRHKRDCPESWSSQVVPQTLTTGSEFCPQRRAGLCALYLCEVSEQGKQKETRVDLGASIGDMGSVPSLAPPNNSGCTLRGESRGRKAKPSGWPDKTPAISDLKTCAVDAASNSVLTSPSFIRCHHRSGHPGQANGLSSGQSAECCVQIQAQALDPTDPAFICASQTLLLGTFLPFRLLFTISCLHFGKRRGRRKEKG